MMSETPKFKTFRDLRSLPNDAAKSEKPSYTSSTSISSISSDNSISVPDQKSFPKKFEDVTKIETEISPVRDFQKVPNSVTRQSMPSGIFRGKSKQVWDYLWSVSRGAILPTRFIKKSRKEIKQGSGLGSMVTVDAAIEHLQQIGLLKVDKSIGSLNGNSYKIFTPEESIQNLTGSTSISSISRYTSPIQKLDILDILETSNTSITQTQENKETYSSAKTSFKDIEENDDEAFAAMLKVLTDMCEKISGKMPAKNQKENWKELAELLAMELEIAAARTKSISNVPAFLTEHLRRRLLGKPTALKSKLSNSLQVGKTSNFKVEDVEAYKAEPLSKKGRETVLKTIREYLDKGQDEFIISFQDTYTKEDWNWLMKESNAENRKQN
jgi:hypothetical protein